MKPTINYLKSEFGNQAHNQVVNWVNVQYSRGGELHGQTISLRDCAEMDVLKAVKHLRESVSLPLSSLLSGIYVAPRLNSSMSGFEVVTKVSAGCFQEAFNSAGIVIDAIEFAHEGDDVSYQGTAYHTGIKRQKQPDDNAKVVCAFMNFTHTATGLVGSVLLNQEEIEQERNSCVLNMFHGLDVFSDAEWQQSCTALLFKRVISESSFTSLCRVLDGADLTYIQDLIALSEVFYSDSKSGQSDMVIRNDYGKIIARKFHRFNAMDRKKQNDDHYSDNVTPISPGKSAPSTSPDDFETRTKISGFSNF